MAAGFNRPEEINPGGVRKLLHLLESLRDSPAGDVIYRQVEHMLDEIASHHLRVEIVYAGFVGILLEALVSHLTPGSTRYVQVRLLQARLQPPLTAGELETLGEFVEECAGEIKAGNSQEASVLSEAITPLLRAFGIGDEAPAEASTEPARPEAPAATPGAGIRPLPDSARSLDSAAADLSGEDTNLDIVAQAREEVLADEGEAPAAEDEALADEGEAPAAEDEALADEGEAPAAEEETPAGEGGMLAGDHETPSDEGAEAGGAGEAAKDMTPAKQLGEDVRSELEARREDIQKLQATLGQQVVETITQNEEFAEVLEVVLAELRETGELSGIEDLRWTLIREIEKLMKGHNELADKLDSTHHYLQLIESGSRELTDELTRVRLLSLTDELTSLPNRRAFMRRLEDEVARVQRYGFPLSFALMDLDHFKEINDQFGHAAGDEVLRVYSKNILTVFRHHDMVARYGGEEFAVLLPNTDADGAIRALNKVKRRASETRWQCNGAVSRVPSFSAGVSLFKPGESASAFIERADKALYRAKRLGRDRIELDITYETDEGGRDRRRRSTDI